MGQIRPSIPPIMWLVAATWAGAVLGEACWHEGLTAAVPTRSGLTALGVVSALALSRRKVSFLAAALCALSTLLAFSAGARWQAQAAGSVRVGGAVQGVVDRDPSFTRFGPMLTVRIMGTGSGGALVGVRCPPDTPTPSVGAVVRLTGVLRAVDARDREGRAVARRGIVAFMTARRVEEVGWQGGAIGWLRRVRARLGKAIDAHVAGDGGALLSGVLLGDRTKLAGTRLEEDFRALGLSHLVAVSGDHLAIVAAAASWVASSAGAGRRGRAAIGMAAGAAFTVLTGFQASAIRATLMLAAVCGAAFVQRRASAPGGLGVAVLAMVMASPWAVFDVGLQLSALAVVGLILLSPLVGVWIAAALPLPAWLRRSLGATLAAQAVTLPVVAGTFNLVSLAAPLANVAIVPLFAPSIVMGLLGAVSVMVAPPVEGLLLRCSAVPLAVAAGIAHWMAELPAASVPVGWNGTVVGAVCACALGVLWLTWPMPRTAFRARVAASAFAVACLAMGIGAAPGRGARIIVLDVGQGDAILVGDRGQWMLVDLGPKARSLRAALGRHGVRRLDVVVLTHDHADHTGGMGGLSGAVAVGWIGVPAVAEDTWQQERTLSEGLTPRGRVGWRELRAGQRWRIGRVEVDVLWPDGPDDSLSTNDTSVVLQVKTGAVSAVLTGDAEARPQEEMSRDGRLTEVDVLKVPHHGSANGLTDTGADLWHPRLAVISVGEGNRFGHPASATLRRLRRIGAAIARTDQGGDVELITDGRGFRVRRHAGLLACETIRVARADHAHQGMNAAVESGARRRSLSREKCHGRRVVGGSEAGLPHIRSGRTAARTRGPPPPPTCVRGSGPGFQLQRL